MADKLKVWRDAEAAVARVAERVSQGDTTSQKT